MSVKAVTYCSVLQLTNIWHLKGQWVHLALQRIPFAFELFFYLANAGSSHLAQKHVASFGHQTYVGRLVKLIVFENVH